MGTPLVYSTTSSAMTDVKDMQPSPMGTSPLDSTALPAMTDIEDTQLSPTETQSVNDSIPLSSVYKPEAKDEERGFHQQMTPPFLLAEPKARIKKDLSATQGASPARLEGLVAPHWHIGG